MTSLLQSLRLILFRSKVCLICIVPATSILVFGFRTHYILRREKRRVQPTRSQTRQKTHQRRLHQHMFILMIISSVVFCLTCLPISFRQIITSFQVLTGVVTDPSENMNQGAIFTLLLTLNYTVSIIIDLNRI